MKQTDLFPAHPAIDAQIEQFGPDGWNRDFVRPSDAPDPAEVQRAFQILPVTRHKIFQLLFCEEKHRAVPRYAKQGSAFLFSNASHIHNLPLAACLVDPDRISDTLVEHLHLATFEKGESAEIRRQKKEDAIPRLKEIFAHVSRVDPDTTPEHRNSRVLFINGDKDPAIDGLVLITRRHANSSAMFLQIYPDVYTAYRKTFHQCGAHAREIHDLTTVQVGIRAFNQKMDREWRKNASTETRNALVREAEKLRASSIACVQNAVNAHKVKARDLIVKLENLQITRHDGRRIVNPSAAMARMIAIMGLLAQRLGDVGDIDHANTSDRLVLRQAILDGENILHGLCHRLGNIQHYWRTKGSSPLFLARASMDAASRGAAITNIMENVNKFIWARTPKQLRVQPFQSVGLDLSERLNALPDILAKRDKAAFLRHLTTMHQNTNRFFHRIKVGEDGLLYFDSDAETPSPPPSRRRPETPRGRHHTKTETSLPRKTKNDPEA